MKRTSVVVLLIACVELLMFACVSNQPSASIARRVELQPMSPDHLKELCGKLGGVYSPPSPGGVYYCLLPNGGLIACGGTMGCTFDPRTSGKPPPHQLLLRE
jgi:hypothetical protein